MIVMFMLTAIIQDLESTLAPAKKVTVVMMPR